MNVSIASPIASMTGFGHSEGLIDEVTWMWELRSVNGRGLEIRFRLPHGFDAHESALREMAGRVLRRGNVTANLTIRRESRTQLEPDPAAIAQILNLLNVLAKQLPDSPPPRIEALLALPGVLRQVAAEAQAAPNDVVEAIRAGFHTALVEMVTGRRSEGTRLMVLLRGQLAELSDLHAQATTHAADQPAAQRARIMETLHALLKGQAGVPEDRIAQEVALLASRCDVREELDRLASHIEAAHALLTEGTAIGRRLDFLVQEFNREANTLCSKSASVPLTAIGLRIKAVIEQIREQVANIE
jgi:uncharacterized protein (TIGR00255 family)